MKPQEAASETKDKPADNSDDTDEADDEDLGKPNEPTEEEIQQALKYTMMKRAEAEKIKSYKQKVE